jgi:hypothetical protein
MRRLLVGVALSVVLVAAGCSCSAGDDDDTGSGSTHRTTTTTTSTTTASTTGGASGPPDSSSQPEPTLPGGYVNVAEAGGWRLEVLQPTPGATIGSSTTVCTMVSGRSREALVVLDVTLFDPGSSSDGISAQVDSDVGRVPVTVSFPDASPGPHDLRVQLILNGDRIDGAVVTVPGVVVSEGADTSGTACA